LWDLVYSWYVYLILIRILGLSKIHSCPNCSKKYIRDGSGRAIAIFCLTRLLWDHNDIDKASDEAVVEVGIGSGTGEEPSGWDPGESRDGGDEGGVCEKEGGSSMDDGEGQGRKDPKEKQDVGRPRQPTSSQVTTLGPKGIDLNRVGA
jgi:hypothetical protein